MRDIFQNNTVTTFPDITKVEFIKINKNYLKVILINVFLFFILFFTGLVLVHQFVFPQEVNEFIIPIYSLFIAIFGFIIWYLILSFTKRKYALREKDISFVILKCLHCRR
jgi:hypothetical protein